MAQCRVADCDRSSRCWGLCEAHARRQRKYGDPLGQPPAAPLPAQRFWSKVDKAGPLSALCSGRCWSWTAATFAGGYGAFWLAGKQVKAHRFAYEELLGPIPRGLVIDHLCRNPNCVNPAHLEPVTNAVNLLRGEGIGAQNLAKTHCKRGHEFTRENTYVFGPDGRYRACKTCERAKTRRLRAAKRAKA